MFGKNKKGSMVIANKVACEGDENDKRGNWSGRFDFILSSVGYAVGLGNIWRFPFKAYENGGASFLIPYVIMLIFAGLPLFFLEMAFGQYGSLGPISVWAAMPLFKGLGYAMVIISALVCIYYNMIIAYGFYYLFASFRSDVPWSECKDEWITKYNCSLRDLGENATIRREEIRAQCDNGTLPIGSNYGLMCNPVSPAQIYWEREVLDISGGIDDATSEFKWYLVLCLLLSWIVVFLCLIKGIKSSGKVVYFTAVFPYIVIIILLIRGSLLDGAKDGIEYYVIPKWENLKDSKPWHDAATQIFYSLGVAFGGLETMASYNKFKNNVYRDAIFVAILNCFTSILAGFAVFALIGHMSHRSGLPIEDVVDGGPGLVFIVYPEGIAMMPVSTFWSILFFIMLLTLGLDSQFTMMETVITAISDEFKTLRKYKIIFTAFICSLFFLIGLPQCSRGGIYVMQLFDNYSASYALMIVSLLELIAIAWIYDFRRFSRDIKCMLGFKPDYYWLAMWIFCTPALILFILGFSIRNYQKFKYGGYVYPDWANGLGWLMVAAALFVIPLLALIELFKAYKSSGSFQKAITIAVSSTSEWGPYRDEYREERELVERDYKESCSTNPAFKFEDQKI
ncbi:DgyrCDS8037 [Dimorphilus gyrociliatus]|uniref:Transporter n=1 Tax=Dimorphilus gyrociliatus TaxID=2664684 RepID=A0A7I8VVE4_9ANNE|nr:DgyrCDS8037 [Dimorphilus gyrociliatus]